MYNFLLKKKYRYTLVLESLGDTSNKNEIVSRGCVFNKQNKNKIHLNTNSCETNQ